MVDGQFDHDQAGKVNNIIDSMEETRREKRIHE